MTREHAKELLPIITAYAEGKTIEHDIGGWKTLENPTFRDPPERYRVAPEPDPYAHLKAAQAAGKQLQRDAYSNGQWEDVGAVSFLFEPEQYRIKPTPKQVLIKSEDLPAGMIWLMKPEKAQELVYVIRPDGDLETYCRIGSIELLHSEGILWSPDRKTWNSFMKEVEG